MSGKILLRRFSVLTFNASSFMLQYCCGTGDCDAASPATSVAEANARQLQGFSSIVSLGIENMTAEADVGKRDFDGVEISWSKRSPSSMSQQARNAAAKEKTAVEAPKVEKRDECKTYTENRRYTKGEGQAKVSPTQNCNSNDGCRITIENSVTTGRQIGVSVGFDLFSVISASVEMTFTEEKTHSISNSYMQASGTRGYVSFIPTYECTEGTVSDCGDDGLQNGDVIWACTPRLIGSGSNEQQDVSEIGPFANSYRTDHPTGHLQLRLRVNVSSHSDRRRAESSERNQGSFCLGSPGALRGDWDMQKLDRRAWCTVRTVRSWSRHKPEKNSHSFEDKLFHRPTSLAEGVWQLSAIDQQ